MFRSLITTVLIALCLTDEDLYIWKSLSDADAESYGAGSKIVDFNLNEYPLEFEATNYGKDYCRYL